MLPNSRFLFKSSKSLNLNSFSMVFHWKVTQNITNISKSTRLLLHVFEKCQGSLPLTALGHCLVREHRRHSEILQQHITAETTRVCPKHWLCLCEACRQQLPACQIEPQNSPSILTTLTVIEPNQCSKKISPPPNRWPLQGALWQYRVTA